MEEGYLTRDPSAGLHYPRLPKTLPRNILTPQEARRIIEKPDTQTVLGYRDRTILEVVYATGLRKSELMNLVVGDVNLEEELLRINRGKGDKDRVVPLSHISCQYLETYLKAIRPQLLGDGQTDKLFLSQQGRGMGKNTISYLVEKYARLAKIKKHVTCHVWRHSCATHLLKNQANLRHVQAILGHRSLSTTERYLHLTITDLKEAHRKFHPREKPQPPA
jgi:integrase/recombinase XerD